MPTKLETKLKNGSFAITAELFPPKGVDVSALLQNAVRIAQVVDAVNVTDCQRAVMRISALAVSRLLIEHGIEPVYQLTCRDRNRLALQSDLLGAYALGIRNILLLSGDFPTSGDHPDAKPVYDVDTLQLIETVRALEQGKDLAGKTLKGSPHFFIGAAVNPTSTPRELAIAMMKKKVAHGVAFFQSQPVFDIEDFLQFKQSIADAGFAQPPKILVGVLLLKSREFAERIAHIPGMRVPEEIIRRIASAYDPLNEGIALCAELIRALRATEDGVHIMAIGAEEHILEIVSRAQ